MPRWPLNSPREIQRSTSSKTWTGMANKNTSLFLTNQLYIIYLHNRVTVKFKDVCYIKQNKKTLSTLQYTLKGPLILICSLSMWKDYWKGPHPTKPPNFHPHPHISRHTYTWCCKGVKVKGRQTCQNWGQYTHIYIIYLSNLAFGSI